MLITFEGIDGCGKSTQAQLLKERLEVEGVDTLLLREPGGTQLSEHIRGLLLEHQFVHPLTAEAELMLFAASRAQLVREVILPALAAEKVVILDRFTDSTIAYQGFGRGLPLTHVEHICQLSAGELEPDMTFLLDVPMDVAVSRRKSKGDDRIESESRTFYSHVVQGYMHLAQKHRSRIHVINGEDPLDHIHHNIWRLVDYERGNDIKHARQVDLASTLY
jgi:dTMP kinase